MLVTQSPSGTTTETFVVQFRRPIARRNNWLTIADASAFNTAGDAWNWTYDNPLPFEMRVVRRVIHETVEARPLDI